MKRMMGLALLLSSAVFLPYLAVAAETPPPATTATTELLLFQEVPDIVVATLKEQKVTAAPATVHVITDEDIKVKGYRTIKDILVDLPGWVDLSDANENIVAARGVFASTTNKILFLINGHRMNDFNLGRWNTDFFLGMDTIKRVEVITGPGSVLYGSGALMGVVNIVTKKGSDVNGTYFKNKVTRWKSNTYDYEEGLTWGKKDGKLDVLFNFSYLNADGDHIPQSESLDNPPAGRPRIPGVVYYNKYDRNWSLFGEMSYEDMSLNIRQDHFSRFAPRAVNSSFLDLGSELIPHYFSWNQTSIDLKYFIKIGEQSKITFNPGYNDYDLHEYAHTTSSGYDANRMPPYGTDSGQLSRYDHWQIKSNYENQLMDKLNLIVGEDFFYTDLYDVDGINATTGGPFPIVPGDRGTWTVWGVYAQAIWNPLEQLDVTVGGRFDNFGSYADPRFTPRVGLVHRIMESLTEKVLYGESYTSPEWAHMKVVTSGGLYNPDPNMKPEIFKGLEYILQYSTPGAMVSLDLFQNLVEGLISANGAFSYTNFGNLRYRGLELEGKYNVLNNFQVNGSYSFVADRGDTTPDRSLMIEGSIKNIPANIYRVGFTYSPMADLSLLLWGRSYSGVRTTDNVTGNTYIDAWTTLDATVNYKWNVIDLQAGVANILDRDYTVGGSVSRPLPRPGRSFSLTAGIKF